VSWAWFFDVDGTLVEIASTPSSIVVSDDLPQIITRLHELSGGAVSLITGRAISDVERFLPLPGVPVAGQHGLEMRHASGEFAMDNSASDSLEPIEAELRELSKRHEGLLVEPKGASIALHYRRAPRLAGYAHRVMRTLQSRHAPELMIQKGKLVVELKPADADKGSAIQTLMQSAPFRGRIPAFVGDDVTDEAGFKLVNEMGGHSIKVGPGRSAAKWRLRNVSAVREWLRHAVAK
jgi:trehalose 6-phosphate phosphatase